MLVLCCILDTFCRAQGHHNKKHLRSKSLVLPSSNSVSNPSPVVRRFLRPSSTVSYTSTSYSHLKIIETEFTCKETADENHTSRFSLTPGDLVLRRGNSLILKMKTSLIVSCEYIVTLVFATAATMKRERFGEFRATGCAKETEELWLSIEIPSNFPIGKFQPHVTLTLKGLLEVFTHFHQGNIIILFNPLNPGKGGAQHAIYMVMLWTCVVYTLGRKHCIHDVQLQVK